MTLRPSDIALVAAVTARPVAGLAEPPEVVAPCPGRARGSAPRAVRETPARVTVRRDTP
jgi:hypothetical protein